MLTRSFFSRPPARRQRGLSLVELMVGIAIGLFVVAAGVLGATTSLRENRQLLLEARLQQDLRAAMDLVTRDVRRAGYWGNAITSMPTKTVASVANPYVTLTLANMPERGTRGTTPYFAEATTYTNTLTYYWDKDNNNTVATDETYQFDLDSGALRMRNGDSGFQQLTDPASIVVTGFSVRPRVTWLPLYDKCPTACNPATQNCPELAVRSLQIMIRAQTPDASVRRTLRSDVRIRNDQLTGACP